MAGLGSAGSSAEDCLMSIVPELGSNGPVIVDQGSTTGTNGTGCDGCTVDQVVIKVTWAHTAGAWVTGLGADIRLSAQAGDVSILRWRAKESLECGVTKSVSVTQPVPAGSGGSLSLLNFKCNSCQ
jgi:hypothetical protein